MACRINLSGWVMLLSLIVLISSSACSLFRDDPGGGSSSPPGNSTKAGPSPTGGGKGQVVIQPGGGKGQVVIQPGGGKGQVVIQPGGGLVGGMQLTKDGQNVWPPQGPGCDQLVACCQSASAIASDVALFCQMSVATEPVSCSKALQDVSTYLGERGMKAPPPCAQ